MYQIDYVGAVRRRWWLVLALGVVGALLAMMLAPNGPTKATTGWNFEATTLVGVPASTTPAGAASYSGGVTPSQVIFFAQKESILAAAAKDAGLNIPSSQLVGHLYPFGATAKHGLIPGELDLIAQGATPAAAATLANAYAKQLGSYLNLLVLNRYNGQLNTLKATISNLTTQQRLLGLGGKGTPGQLASVNDRLSSANSQLSQLQASAPTSGFQVLVPASDTNAVHVPGTSSKLAVSGKTGLLLGLVGGLLIGLGVVLLLEFLDKRIRAASRAEVAFGYPVVSEIPEPPKVGPTAPFELFGPAAQSSSPTAEAFRMLRMSIMLEGLAPVDYDGDGSNAPVEHTQRRPVETVSADLDDYDDYDNEMQRDGRQVVLVVSAGVEPTCATVVTNLAASYGEAGHSVLVMSTKELHGGLVRPEGHAVRVKPSEMEDHLRPSRIDNVVSISLGDFVDSSGELATMAPPILDEARKLAEIVIIEAPAMLGFHDAAAFSPESDVVLVVGESAITTTDEGKRSGELLKRIGAPVLGVVFTNVRLHGKDVRVAVQKLSPPVAASVGATQTKVVAAAPAPAAPAHTPAPADAEPEVLAPEAELDLDHDSHSVLEGETNDNGNGNGHGHKVAVEAKNGNGHRVAGNGNGRRAATNGNGNKAVGNGNNGVETEPSATDNP